MSAQSICLAGSSGLLGSSFLAAQSVELGITQIDRHLLIPEAQDELVAKLAQTGSSICVNCVAHTDVEGAETDHDANWRGNVLIPRLIARACRINGMRLIHFSSTGCYGNWKDDPYTEEDPCRPTTAHHRAKYNGEQEIADAGCDHLILRLGWLYGGAAGQPKNFVWKRILEARSKNEMTSDASQRGCPSFVNNVRDQTLRLIDTSEQGVFNVVSRGSSTRFEYVREIVRAAAENCCVQPGAAFKRIADVSPNETAINARLMAVGLDQMPTWRDSLCGYVDALVNSTNAPN